MTLVTLYCFATLLSEKIFEALQSWTLISHISHKKNKNNKMGVYTGINYNILQQTVEQAIRNEAIRNEAIRNEAIRNEKVAAFLFVFFMICVFILIIVCEYCDIIRTSNLTTCQISPFTREIRQEIRRRIIKAAELKYSPFTREIRKEIRRRIIIRILCRPPPAS